MTATVKQQFIAELEPLLVKAERAIVGDNKAEARNLALEMLKLVGVYSNKLDPAELRDALNNPTANAIAEKLGVKP